MLRVGPAGARHDCVGYLEVLGGRYVARLLTGTLVGRLPNALAAIAIVLFVREEGGSYTLAGALAAVYGVANAVGQPVLGRLVDLYGQPRIQLPAALGAAAATVVFALAGLDPLPLTYVSVGVAGLLAPPLEGGLRALWPSVLSRQELIHTAYAMDAVAQEVMFTAGPLLVTLTAAAWSAQTALLLLQVLGVLGALTVVTAPPSSGWRSAPRTAHWLGALRSPGLLVMLAAFLFVGIALGSITVAALSYSDSRGGAGTYGWLMAALGLGSLVGGTAYGVRQWSGEPEHRLRLLLVLLALGYLPLALTPPLAAMVALTVVAGVFLAPCIACAFLIVDRHAPTGTVTEAFSWLVTVFTVGAAVGTAVAGPVVEARGAGWGFGLPGAAAALAAVVLFGGAGVLRPPSVRTPAALR